MVVSDNIDVYMLKKHACLVLGRTYVCVRVSSYFLLLVLDTRFHLGMDVRFHACPEKSICNQSDICAIDFVRCRKRSQRFGNEEAKTTSAGVAYNFNGKQEYLQKAMTNMFYRGLFSEKVFVTCLSFSCTLANV